VLTIHAVVGQHSSEVLLL